MNKRVYEDNKAKAIRDLKINRNDVETKLQLAFRELENIAEPEQESELLGRISNLEGDLEFIDSDIEQLTNHTYEDLLKEPKT